jgi:hypothetical protein
VTSHPTAGRTGIAAAFRAVELLSDQLSIPGQNGVWLGYASNLLECFTPEPFADLGARGSRQIGQPEPSGQMRSEDSVFSGQLRIRVNGY